MFIKKQKRPVLKGLVLIVLVFLISSLNFCWVEAGIGDIKTGLEGTAEEAGLKTETTMPTIVGKIIKIIVEFLGLILTVYLIYGGILWMTSGGNEDQIKKAKGMITNAIIGLVIVVLAYAISSFVIERLTTVVSTKQG